MKPKSKTKTAPALPRARVNYWNIRDTKICRAYSCGANCSGFTQAVACLPCRDSAEARRLVTAHNRNRRART